MPNMRLLVRCTAVLVCIVYALSSVEVEAIALPPHPRIRVLPTDIQTIKQNIEKYVEAKTYYQELQSYGDSLLNASVVDCHRSGVEDSLLSQARSVLDRTYSLGLLWRLSGNVTYAKRAIVEMLHVCGPSCIDWNPPHFLDTAEMMHAVGVGYDWLQDVPADIFPDSARVAIENGIAEKVSRAHEHAVVLVTLS